MTNNDYVRTAHDTNTMNRRRNLPVTMHALERAAHVRRQIALKDYAPKVRFAGTEDEELAQPKATLVAEHAAIIHELRGREQARKWFASRKPSARANDNPTRPEQTRADIVRWFERAADC